MADGRVGTSARSCSPNCLQHSLAKAPTCAHMTEMSTLFARTSMRELEYSLTLHSTLQAIAVQLFHRFGRKSDRLIFAVVCDLRVASHRAQISWIWRSRVSDRAVAFVMTWRSGQPFVVARSLSYAHRPGPDGQGCSHLGPGQLGSTGVALGGHGWVSAGCQSRIQSRLSAGCG